MSQDSKDQNPKQQTISKPAPWSPGETNIKSFSGYSLQFTTWASSCPKSKLHSPSTKSDTPPTTPAPSQLSQPSQQSPINPSAKSN
ncbi:HHR131Wp [Eremothecium sinecaudum]|uniref:HHR131Wp n=1 Tax=Eremothecium sinecaudum TaxID=45286 RepID=A0A0X8HWT0_9SACH|nr:HHR131Wp [Eremothecium sinecaudum]AMD22900.1 HHR131Wp [Eremothecium sinecaudum]